MTALIVFFTASFGFAFVVGWSKISLPLRVLLGGQAAKTTDGFPVEIIPLVPPLIPVVGPFLVALAECPGCLGWWTGAIVGAVWPSFVQLAAPGLDEIAVSWWACGVILGLATAGVNMLFAKYVGLIQ